ncbi:MAG: NAD(+) synthase, partial [Rubrobacter sp.]
MRVALAQINTTVGDIWGNVGLMTDALNKAVENGADLVAFPELAITGYPPEDLLLRPSFIQENLHALDEFKAEVPEGVTAAVGFVDLGIDLFNSCAVISGGEILHRYHKRYLPNYGVFDENRYFREGTGSSLLKLDGTLVGVNVCEDIWYPGGPAREQTLGGASVLLNISASPYHRLKGAARERMLSVRASDYGCYVVMCNLVGGQDELVFDGHSVIFDPEGNLVSRAKQFEEDLLFVDIFPEEALMRRLHDSRPRKEEYLGESPAIVEVPAEVGRITPAESDEPRVEDILSEEGEVLAALELGLTDYFGKNGFTKAVLGLSGGIDSTLVAAVAARALGPENVVGVLMPSRYTSDLSNTDAYALAESLGIETQVVPIGPAFDAYREMLSESFAGTEEDITEENLQSRVRGN